MLTRAQKAFREAIEREGGQAKMARKLGVTQASVSNWANGSKIPAGDNREVIEVRLQIPPKWWREPLPSEPRRAA